MVIALNGKRLEASLPDMTAAVIAADMRRHQPLQPTAQVTIFVQPEKQMEMVIQQAVTDQSQEEHVRRRKSPVSAADR